MPRNKPKGFRNRLNTETPLPLPSEVCDHHGSIEEMNLWEYFWSSGYDTRYICRRCGRKFSDPSGDQKNPELGVEKPFPLSVEVCDHRGHIEEMGFWEDITNGVGDGYVDFICRKCGWQGPNPRELYNKNHWNPRYLDYCNCRATFFNPWTEKRPTVCIICEKPFPVGHKFIKNCSHTYSSWKSAVRGSASVIFGGEHYCEICGEKGVLCDSRYCSKCSQYKSFSE